MKVKPANGLMVRHPASRLPIPEEGMDVPETGREATYWLRRLRCGDVVLVSEVLPVAEQLTVADRMARVTVKREDDKR